MKFNRSTLSRVYRRAAEAVVEERAPFAFAVLSDACRGMSVYRSEEVCAALSELLRRELREWFPELSFGIEDVWGSGSRSVEYDYNVHALALCFMAECHRFDEGVTV